MSPKVGVGGGGGQGTGLRRTQRGGWRDEIKEKRGGGRWCASSMDVYVNIEGGGVSTCTCLCVGVWVWVCVWMCVCVGDWAGNTTHLSTIFGSSI